MSRIAIAFALWLSVLTVSVHAKIAGPTPVVQRVTTADMVVVGKVTGFADKTVSAPRFPGDTEKAEFQVALVKVQNGLLGTRGAKEIRVGFVPSPAGFIRRYPQVRLALDGEYCLFLEKHPEADFYVPPMYYSAIDKKSEGFEPAVDEAKKYARLLADPKAGLTSKKQEERTMTAGLLVLRYRQFRPGASRQEPIDPEESKLILRALAGADWTPPREGAPGSYLMTPQSLFLQLGLTEADDWKQPADFNELPKAARKWLDDHADSYRIRRSAPDRKKD